MKLLIKISLTMFLFVGCSSFGVKKTTPPTFFAAWQPRLAYLNQEPKTASAEVMRLNDDLIKLRKAHLTQLRESFKKSSPQDLSADLLRKRENEFFYDAISQQNEAEFSQYWQKSHEESFDHYQLGEHILEEINNNAVASAANVSSYDQGSKIGFCFARALLVHYLLLKAGISQNQLAKVFVLGDLRVDGQFWQFHVATMIKNTERGPLVVDPLLPKPQPLDEWAKHVKSYEIKHPQPRAYFYVTDPRKFFPGTGAYSMSQLSQPALKEYFYELAQSMSVP